MFTGLIERTSAIKSFENTEQLLTLTIENPYETLKLGDSVSVNGVCLTVTDVNMNTFTVEVINETKRITSLSSLEANDEVNLERAMKMDSRLDGHLVSGHVDGSGKITQIRKDGDAFIFNISCPKGLMKYMAYKGSVTIDGISLTLFDVDVASDIIVLNIIPETLRKTTIQNRSVGDSLNIEVDMIMKHIDHLMNYERGGVRNV